MTVKNNVISVSELNRIARELLETAIPPVWISGEISNLTLAASGHAYFSLKDERAQIRAVMFRNRLSQLGFRPKEGLRVEVRGTVSLYEARGDYQINVSLHSANPAVGNFGDNAVEGSYMATVLGVALSYQMRKQPNVACCIIGDGTVGRGEFHESLNMAAIWKLPVLYALVNNGYAISMPVGKGHASPDIVDLARGYGMPCVIVDGNDIELAFAEVQKAIDYIRAGNGPYFLEFKTWRWQGLFSGEFRPAEEIKYWKEEHDPIKLARAKIIENSALTAEDIDRLEAEVKAEIEGWIDYAKQSPMPDPAKATANVYVGWEVAA